MKTTTLKPQATDRRGERGAALITTLLISTLMLAAGASLVFSTMMSATGAIDSTPEQQAYYAAESGLQGALNVLRGNVAASPALATGQTINFRRALTLADSNDTAGGDTSGVSRLSRWLQYNYPDDAGLADRDRIVLGDPNTYSPITGMAYSVAITDPYDQARVVFSTTGTFTAPVVGGGLTASTSNSNTRLSVTDGAGTNRVTLEFVPKAQTTLASAYPSSTSDLGIVRVIEAVGTTNFSGFTNSPKLKIRVSQTAPWSSSDFLEGTIVGSISRSGAGVLTNSLIIRYQSQPIIMADGGTYTITSTSAGSPAVYSVAMSATDTTLATTVVAAEPKYVLVTSTGYGPRGARKQLQMMVSRSTIMIDPPAGHHRGRRRRHHPRPRQLELVRIRRPRVAPGRRRLLDQLRNRHDRGQPRQHPGQRDAGQPLDGRATRRRRAPALLPRLARQRARLPRRVEEAGHAHGRGHRHRPLLHHQAVARQHGRGRRAQADLHRQLRRRGRQPRNG